MKKLIIAATLTAAIATPAQAEDGAWTVMKSTTGEAVAYSQTIAEGGATTYVSEDMVIYVTNGPCEADALYHTVIMDINGQAVNMARRCTKSGTTMMMTPESDAGFNHMLNQFRVSTAVRFEGSDSDVTYSAKGFTAAYNESNSSQNKPL